MQMQTKLAMALLAGSLITIVPAASNAEDDVSFDGKSYPGAMCSPVVSSVPFVRTASLYANTSGAATSVLCPIIQDSWLNAAGLTFGAMDILNPAGTFSCTESAYDVTGAFLSSRSFSTTATGITQQLFFSGTYLPTTGFFGSMTITCSVPTSGQIRSYQVQERA